jgi:hypothetical protein
MYSKDMVRLFMESIQKKFDGKSSEKSPDRNSVPCPSCGSYEYKWKDNNFIIRCDDCGYSRSKKQQMSREEESAND